MIFDGSVGGRWTASAAATSRPSPATSMSPCRTTWTAAPSSRILRYSVTVALLWCGAGSGPRSAGPARGRAVEPQMYLAGADGVLVLSVLAARGGHGALPESADHLQVVAESRLGLELQELGHGVEHP